MKTLKRIGIYFSIYLLLSIGAVMAVQHSWWWMLPSVITITLGNLLYAEITEGAGAVNARVTIIIEQL